MGLRLALTIDDGPTVINPSQEDPTRMDRMCNSLQRLGIKDCVAFVIGRVARGNERILEHWLESGYELGKHTFNHAPPSEMSLQEFTKSVKKCDSLLRSVGAFEKKKRSWFRFPYLDRGATPQQRKILAAVLNDMGYDIAHASAQFFDHHFETPLITARGMSDEHRVKDVGKRFVQVAQESIAHQARRVKLSCGSEAPLISFCHFGPVSEFYLADVLTNLSEKDVKWCSLDEAHNHQIYHDYNNDYKRGGFLTNTLPESIGRKMVRLIMRCTNRFYIDKINTFGPRFPYLE